jgi:hypothetical protein
MDDKTDLPEILPVKSDLIFRLFFADERNEQKDHTHRNPA